MNNIRMFSFFALTFVLATAQAAEMGIPVQLRLKSPAGIYPTEAGVTMKLQILSNAGCVLREESFLSQNITNGSVSLAIGFGTAAGFDPAISINQVLNNSSIKSGLTCVDAAGAVISTSQTYKPGPNDSRIIRFTAVVQGELLNVDFPLKSVAYAVQAESVGGKAGADILVQNGLTQLNQANLESVFASSGNVSNLVSIASTGVAGSAVNFSGSLSGDVSGSQSSVSVNKIKGVAVGNVAPTVGQVLQFDGLQYVPASLADGAVTSVAGKIGTVVLSTGDITGLAPVVADVAAATSSNVASAIIKRDASGNASLNSLSSNNVSTQNVYIFESTNTNRVQLKAPTTFLDYALTLPSGLGTNGQLLATDALGNLSWTSPAGLSNTAVIPGAYGNASQVGSFTVDAQGRLSAAAAMPIAINTSQINASGALVGQALKWNGSAWTASPDSNSGGTVTNVSSANAFLSVASGAAAPILTLNVGTIANTVAAGDDARIVGALQQAAFNGYVASANCTAIQSMYWNSVSSTFLCQAIGTVPNATTAVNFSGAIAGDVSGTQAAASVDKIKGVPVSVTAPVSGQALVYDGVQWVATTGFPTFARATADQTFSVTGLANATGLSFPVIAGKVYKYKFNVLSTSAAVTTGARLGLIYPTATTASATANIASGADGTAAIFSGVINSSGDSVLSANTPAIAPLVMFNTVEGIISPSVSGTVQLQAATEVAASNIVIKAGSFVEVTILP